MEIFSSITRDLLLHHRLLPGVIRGGVGREREISSSSSLAGSYLESVLVVWWKERFPPPPLSPSLGSYQESVWAVWVEREISSSSSFSLTRLLPGVSLDGVGGERDLLFLLFLPHWALTRSQSGWCGWREISFSLTGLLPGVSLDGVG